MDTSAAGLIFGNMDSKNRNMVRKAQKAGIKVVKKPLDNYQEFYEMYCETMRQHDAEDYYTFSEKYFEFMSGSLNDNAALFYAMLDGNPVGGSVFLFNKKAIHYHLAGMYPEYRNLAVGNLLLYEAAVWAAENGIARLHLGGGLNGNDSLFGFKKQFNKNGRLPFYVGRTIFIRPVYDYLLGVRKQLDAEFDPNNDFLIQYRR
jgi:lipid II:glycine glycyltransferase (peptidoglycan interpeptide bridge formation enzyme)